jgi:hypothetical protein
MLQSCSILSMILIMNLNFSKKNLFWFITISIAKWSLFNNSCTICLNLKIYELTSHGLEDPWVTNKQPYLIDWCVCLQIYPNSMMHSSKLNYSHGEQKGAICGRQTWTTTSWHNKHPIMNCGSLENQTLAQGSVGRRSIYQSLVVFKMKDRYPIVINWVYTHLLIGVQYLSNNQFGYNNHSSWSFKKSKNFPKFHQIFWVNSFMKIICSLKFLK